MKMTAWRPFNELEHILAGYRGMPLAGDGDEGEFAWRPVSDISETDSEYLVKAELPEVKRKDITVSIEDGVLKIEGERRIEKRTKGEKQHRMESMYGHFYRAFSLPQDVDPDAVNAECKDGVLTVHLPKTEPRGDVGRKIEIS